HHVVAGGAHALDLDGARAGDPASAAQQVDAMIGQPALLPGIGVVRDHEVTPCKRRLDIDLGARGRLSRPMNRLARPQQRLRRNARPVGTLPSHQLAFYDGHAQAALGQSARAVLARRAPAEHDHVVLVVHVGSSSPAGGLPVALLTWTLLISASISWWRHDRATRPRRPAGHAAT